MTPDKLIEIAKRGGTIQWKTGVRQKLAIHKDDQVYATDDYGNVTAMALCTSYQCSEIIQSPTNHIVDHTPAVLAEPQFVYQPGIGVVPKR